MSDIQTLPFNPLCSDEEADKILLTWKGLAECAGKCTKSLDRYADPKRYPEPMKVILNPNGGRQTTWGEYRRFCERAGIETQKSLRERFPLKR